MFLLLAGMATSYGQATSQKEKVIQTLEDFHQAILDNDDSAAQKLLSDSIQILEGGSIETKQEYLSHHFHEDGKFLRAMQQKVDSRTVNMEGNTAWVSTKTHTWGTYRDHELDLNSLELAVLVKEDETWKITALHWSSADKK